MTLEKISHLPLPDKRVVDIANTGRLKHIATIDVAEWMQLSVGSGPYFLLLLLFFLCLVSLSVCSICEALF